MKNNAVIGSVSYPRVLFFSHETTLTGAPMQLAHLVTVLNERGWKAVFAADEAGPISDLIKKTGTRVELNKSFRADPEHKELRALCREFDLVVANTIVGWPAVMAAHQEKVPVIWYIHETLVAARLIKEIPEIKTALNLPTLILVPTKQTARVLGGATPIRIEILPYGIPEAAAALSKPSRKSISFVVIGSFEPRKGQDILVDAIGRLDRSVAKAASFVLAGRPLDRQFYSKIRDRAAVLENVELIESLDHEAALRLIGESHVLICPSRDEAMPVVILEAMSLGKAIIGSDVGGIGEWIHDDLNGLLVPTENPVALAKAITRCVQDPELLQRLGTIARRTYECHFTIDRLANRFTELVQDAMRPPVPPDASSQQKYTRWIEAFDRETAGSRLAVSHRIRQLPRHPLISILLPVYNPNLTFLQEAIESVQNQIYPAWELCIADDASTNGDVRPFLEEKARRDSRIKVIFREQNGHIAACSNSALSLATGEWCALLDQDDLFSENALAFVAFEITQYPDAGLIYSDEDKIDNQGKRSNPFFKTDWNPELFLAQNYINHLGAYRTAILRDVGGFREGYEGSQDYDVALRCIEKLDAEQVRHIPRILYHWRMVEGSLAAVPNAKPYAKDAARRAIADHLRRMSKAGRVEPCPENIESHRVVYALPAASPLVSIIIPTRDRADLLERCVGSIIERSDYGSLEIILVDNDSTEANSRELFARFESDKTARVLRDRGDFNYGRLNNLAATQARGEILLFLNSDTEVDDRGWLTEIVSHAARAEVGAVGARLWYPDGTLQHGGVVLGLAGLARHAFPGIPRSHPGYFNRAFLQQDCSAVTGACMAVRKQVFEEFDGFDEENLVVNFSDIDLCLRLRASGYEIIWTPYANLIHHESASRGYQRTAQEQAQFLREASYMRNKWGPQLMNDPFYNPNLSLNPPGFEIAFPPRLPEFRQRF